jgi:hypothetical protein
MPLREVVTAVLRPTGVTTQPGHAPPPDCDLG